MRLLSKKMFNYARKGTNNLLNVYERLLNALFAVGSLKEVTVESVKISQRRYKMPVFSSNEPEQIGFKSGLNNRQFFVLHALRNCQFKKSQDYDAGELLKTKVNKR